MTGLICIAGLIALAVASAGWAACAGGGQADDTRQCVHGVPLGDECQHCPDGYPVGPADDVCRRCETDGCLGHCWGGEYDGEPDPATRRPL